ncbi:MAG: cation:proton antiporter [Alphaproteobacteria bacterium]|nr:cation:proton antiporter [Alphaproteobacteria bacterium]
MAVTGHENGVPHLYEVLVFLLATVVIVPLVQRLKASPVLGYLLVGAVIGPAGLAVIESTEGVRPFAELGVVFLLFTIGLELSVERLRTLHRYVFGLGLVQVAFSGLVIGLVAWAWGNPAPAASVIGACLALSSTAMVMQVLVERGEIASRAGRVSFSILLFQDLAVVPILIVVSALGQGSEHGLIPLAGISVAKAVLVIGVIFLLGQFLFRGVLRAVASTGTSELVTATTLLVILGVSYATGMAGLSMALGAFLAGVLLADTEFRHQVETDIQPFKGILLGLFFISVGMELDLARLASDPVLILASVLGLFAIKAAILLAICLVFTLPLETSLRTALSLGGAGEFAFVVLGSAMTRGVLAPETAHFLELVAGISMALTPIVLPLASRLAGTIAGPPKANATDRPPTAELADHVVICGYGRVGQTVAELLSMQKVPYVALDLDIARTRTRRAKGEPVFYGDASRADVLESVRIDRASAAVITMSSAKAAERAFAIVRERWPGLPLFVRTRDEGEAEAFAALGVPHVVPETLESSLQLAGRILNALGAPMEAVNTLIERIRSERYQRISGLGETPKEG